LPGSDWACESAESCTPPEAQKINLTVSDKKDKRSRGGLQLWCWEGEIEGPNDLREGRESEKR